MAPIDQSKEFDRNVLKHTHEIFWAPEIERRGGADAVGALKKALAVMRPNQPVEIFLNDEALLVAQIHFARQIEPGESYGPEDILDVDGLRPATVDRDAGWAAYLALPVGNFLTFDYRRYVGTAAEILALSDQYLVTAQASLRAEHLGPALENSLAAAELAVTAMMYIMSHDPTGPSRSLHSRRQGWLNQFTRLGNAPRDFHRVLVRLGQLRPASRYGDRRPAIDTREVPDLVATVAALVEHAHARVGEPLTDVLPELEAAVSD